MLIDSERYIEQALKTADFLSWAQFTRRMFTSILVDDYPSDVLQEVIRTNPARLGNQDYWKFYAVVLGHAATLGFVEATGQQKRHDFRRFEGSYSDPIHLLALDRYLVEFNIESARQKHDVIGNSERDLRRPLKLSEVEAVWAVNGLGNDGKIQIKAPHQLKKPSHERTIVCVPNISRLHEISQIEISGSAAGKMSEGEFVVTQLPLVRRIYGHLIDVDKVFFGKGERWPAGSRSNFKD